MATITINPSVVAHTMPTYFYGWNLSAYYRGDYQDPNWLSVMEALHPECLRIHWWHIAMNTVEHQTVPPAIKSGLSIDPAILLELEVHPASLPVSTAAPNDYANWSNGSQYGQAAIEAAIASWVNSGLTVKWIQVSNEHSNNRGTTNPAEWWNPWYSTVLGYGAPQSDQAARLKCESWGIVQQRRFVDIAKNKMAALGAPTPRISAPAYGTGEAEGYTLTHLRNWVNGTPLQDGTSSPHGSPSNLPYFDIWDSHPYPNFGSGTSVAGAQDAINSCWYPTWGVGDASARMYGSCVASYERWRQELNALGGSAKAMAADEFGELAHPWVSALSDVTQFIISCVFQPRWNLEYWMPHAGGRSAQTLPAHDGFAKITTSTWPSNPSLLSRYYCHRDMISPFMRTYKKQFLQADGSGIIAGVVGSGACPNGTVPNGHAQRIKCAAGINSAGDKVGFLLQNCDLTNAESVTLNWTVSATGNATTVRAGSVKIGSSGWYDQMVTGGSLATNGLSQITFSVAAGDAYFIEVPIGTVTPPPPPTSYTPLDQLSDPMTDASIDTAKWDTAGSGTGYSITETTNGLEVTVGAGTGWYEVQSDNMYDARGVRGWMRIVDAGDQAQNIGPFYQLHVNRTEDYVGIRVGAGSVVGYTNVAGSRVNVVTVPYVPASHTYLGIRESGGTTYWETGVVDATGKNIAWTTIHSQGNAISMSPIEVRCGASRDTGSGTSDVITVKHFSVMPDEATPPEPPPPPPPPPPNPYRTATQRTTVVARTVAPSARIPGLGGGGI